MNTDSVGQCSLHQRNDGTADNCHDQQAGAIPGERTQFAIPKVKMLGNITELKRPTKMIAHIATWPNASIEHATSAQATSAAIPSTTSVGNF